MKELEKYRTVLRKLPAGIQEAEIQGEKLISVEAAVQDGKSVGMSYQEQTELFVRAAGEHTGLVYTQNLSEDPEKVLKKALENSMEAGKKEPMNDAGSLQKVRETIGWKSGDNEEKAPKEVEAIELHQAARKLEENIRQQFPEIAGSEVKITEILRTVGVLNSKGVDESRHTGRFDVSVSLTEKGNPMRRYEETSAAGSLKELKVVEGRLQEGIRRFLMEKGPAGRFCPGTYRTVLSSQVVNFMLITAWQMFSGQNYLSGRTPLREQLGNAVFSECIYIEDKAQAPYPFELDLEGTPSRDVELVRGGVLTGLLHHLSSAEGLGVLSTGNAGRKAFLAGSIHTDMTVIPKNFVMREGDVSLPELICRCSEGIFITQSYDQFHALNTVTGDFMFPCRGILIREGKLAEEVSGLSMNGNFLELLKGVEAVGNYRQMEPMTMYNNYTVSGPDLLVESLKISG